LNTALKVLLLFIDGIGIGKKDKENNPFFFTELPALRKILGGELPSLRKRRISTGYATVIPADTRLGVSGLPQSGTGQTSIFCGINAPKIIGKHFGPYPYSELRPYIKEMNIFHILKEKNKKVCFVNAYPKQFFEYIASGKTRLSVTTLSCLMSGVPLLGYEELKKGKAVSADITAEGWKRFGYDIKPVDPFIAGKRLYSIAKKNDFTVFEYFYTDHAGHSKDKEFAKKVLSKYDKFFSGILENYDKNKLFIFIVSDHGNLEDLSVKTHTLNPVPVILIGKRKEYYAKKIKDITDTTKIVNLILK
jgi:2,3-bisphosphoglycerate-independent phosphoglycerate mutase